VGAIVLPSLRPIRDLAEATVRVSTGDYGQRLPVVQDDDLGALAASFNRMQAGLAERQRLQAAFGTYVDPALAARLLEQGDDVFTGERREVTVIFVDVRDFTPFAEANTAEDTVARLNALFEIVVPAVVDAGLQRIDDVLRLAQSRARQLAVQLDRGDCVPGAGQRDDFRGHTTELRRCLACERRARNLGRLG
jgi:class 3 adenylate cyclase